MQFLEEEIRQVTETVWESVLGLTVVRQSASPPATGRTVSGRVQFTGAWEGAVTLECSAEFARHAAATMFGINPAQTSVADTQDAMGELVNMTGGNVKALLPEPCRLSLPTVIEGSDYSTHLHGGELVTMVAFDCQGSPLVVRLLKKRAPQREEVQMSEVPIPHRREFSRVNVHLRGEITAEGVAHVDGTIEDLSLKGAFFRAAVTPRIGVSCDVRLRLDGTEIEVHALGKVVRITPDGCAIQFTEIIGIDCLEHLRNLILFNAADTGQVEREFHGHLGLRQDQ